MSNVVSKRGVVAELLIVIVIAASVLLFVLTFANKDDTPSIARKTLDAIIDLRTAISQGILDWLAEGITNDDFSCNGLYPMSSQLNTFLASLIPYIEQYLPDQPITDGDVTVNPGTVADIQFTDDGIVIIMDGGTIVYDDGSIYANDSIDQTLNFGIQLPLLIDRLENWTLCDHGELGQRLKEQLGTYCFFGKHKIDCGTSATAMRIGVGDKDYLMNYAPSISMITESLENVTGILNNYLAGEDSCGGDPIPEASGITCEFQVMDVDLTYLMAPWYPDDIGTGSDYRVLDFPASFDSGPGPKYDLAMYRSDDYSHVWALPPVVTYAHVQDEELGCVDEPREVVPSGIPHGPFVDNIIEPWAGPLTETFNQQNSPHIFVNTTRGLAFKAVLSCTDSSISLLGQPVTYRFSFSYGVKQHCGNPSLEVQNQEPVCRPCGVPTDLDVGGCYDTYFNKPCGWYERKCNESMDWLWLNGGGGHLNVADRNMLIHDQFPKAFHPDGAPWLSASDGQYEAYLVYRAGKCVTPEDTEFVGEQAPCAYAWNFICCGAPGYNKTCPQETAVKQQAPWAGSSDYCYMDQQDYSQACLRSIPCFPPDQFDIGKPCITPSCQPSEGAPGGWECLVPDPVTPEAIDAGGLVGNSCSGQTGCHWCSDGSDLLGDRDNPLYGHCVYNMNFDSNGESCNPLYGASACFDAECVGSGPMNGSCDDTANPHDEGEPCTVMNPQDCKKGVCGGLFGCEEIPDPDKVNQDCGDYDFYRDCTMPDGTAGTQDCSVDKLCNAAGNCNTDHGATPSCTSCSTDPPAGTVCDPLNGDPWC